MGNKIVKFFLLMGTHAKIFIHFGTFSFLYDFFLSLKL